MSSRRSPQAMRNVEAATESRRSRSVPRLRASAARLATPASAEELLALKREIERVERESKQALAVVEEIYGSSRPNMRVVVPRRSS